MKAIIALSVLVLACRLVYAQPDILIESLDENGVITWQNINTALYYRVQWTTTPENENTWHDDYTPLIDVTSTGATVTAPMPRYFRVVGGSEMLVPEAVNVKAGTMVQGVSGTFWEGNRFDIGTDTNTIVDYKTGLMWPRSQKLGISIYGFRTNWGGAVNFCESFSLAGYDDWRMPTGQELYSLSDENQFALDNVNGERTPMQRLDLPFLFWSSDESGSTALRVGVPGGGNHYDSKTATDNAVLPVRNITY